MDRSHRCDLYVPCTLQGTITYPLQRHCWRWLSSSRLMGPTRSRSLEGISMNRIRGSWIIFITEGRWELHSTFGCKAWVCVLGPLPGALVVLVPTVVTDLLREGHGPLVVRVEGGRVLPNGAASVLVSPWPTAGRLLAYDLNAVSCQILELWYQAMMPWCHVVGTKGFLYVCTNPKLAGVTCKSCWVMYIVYIGTTPRNGRHHQDYEPFLGAGIPTRKLHLWLESWVGGRPKV